MKKKKENKKGKNSRIEIKKEILIFTMLFCIIIAMITYWIYAYNHKHNSLYFDDRVISYKISDYVSIEGNLVYLKNINKDITNDFLNKQREIISNKQIIDTNITKQLVNNILSIKISYTLANELGNYDKIITLNIDLKKDILLTNEEMLNLVNKTFKDVATDIFNEYVKLPTSSTLTVIDAISLEELTSDEFNQNSEKYIIRIREKLPDILEMYIYKDILYYSVNLSEIYEICYYKNTDVMVNINRQIGEI